MTTNDNLRGLLKEIRLMVPMKHMIRIDAALAAPDSGEAVPAVEQYEIGLYGKAYDGPGVCRAYTYDHQPDNLAAWRLGAAACSPAHKKGGDHIDFGLGLLLDLKNQGFGVFELNKAPAKAEPFVFSDSPDGCAAEAYYKRLDKEASTDE